MKNLIDHDKKGSPDMNYRAILQEGHNPRRVVPIKATSLASAKRESIKSYAQGLQKDSAIILESWDGSARFVTGDEAWAEVCYCSLNDIKKVWVKM